METPPYIRLTNPLAKDYWAEAQDYSPCDYPGCETWVSPEERERARTTEPSGQVTCPGCGGSYEPVEPGALFTSGKPGGYARVGIKNTYMGNLAECIVYKDVTPSPQWRQRYGDPVFWQPNVCRTDVISGSGNPLDGITRDPTGTCWGVEVKGTDTSNVQPKFIVGRDEQAIKMAYSIAIPEELQRIGVPPRLEHLLGVAVLFDYTKSLAHVWVKEMTVSPWKANNGKTVEGFGSFYPHDRSSTLLLADVPFKNPFMDPEYDGPHFVTRQNADVPF